MGLLAPYKREVSRAGADRQCLPQQEIKKTINTEKGILKMGHASGHTLEALQPRASFSVSLMLWSVVPRAVSPVRPEVSVVQLCTL